MDQLLPSPLLMLVLLHPPDQPDNCHYHAHQLLSHPPPMPLLPSRPSDHRHRADWILPSSPLMRHQPDRPYDHRYHVDQLLLHLPSKLTMPLLPSWSFSYHYSVERFLLSPPLMPATPPQPYRPPPTPWVWLSRLPMPTTRLPSCLQLRPALPCLPARPHHTSSPYPTRNLMLSYGCLLLHPTTTTCTGLQATMVCNQLESPNRVVECCSATIDVKSSVRQLSRQAISGLLPASPGNASHCCIQPEIYIKLCFSSTTKHCGGAIDYRQFLQWKGPTMSR